MQIPKSYSQLLVILISAIIAYSLFDANPGGDFDPDLLLAVLIPSIITIGILLVLTYEIQRKVAKSLGCDLDYEFWPWGIFASVFVSIMSVGTIPFFMPGIFWLEKRHDGFGKRLPGVSRVEAAAIAGVGPTLGLIVAIIFINSAFVSMAAALYAIFSMLAIPKTNGFHYFNWHPLHGGLVSVLGLVLLFSYVLSPQPLTPFLFLALLVFIPYNWFYVFVLAKRTGYK